MKKLIYFISFASLISCKKHKTASSDTENNYTCECETKTEYIDNCRVDSVESKQTVLAKNSSEADGACKNLNFENSNTETKTSKKCELK